MSPLHHSPHTATARVTYDAWIRSFLDDPALREGVLTHIVSTGGPADLPLFLGILESHEDPRYQAAAYKAVQSWGTLELRRRIFASALDEDNEVLIQSALLAFTDVGSSEIKESLCSFRMQAE